MKKTLIFLVVLLFSIATTSCDHDECPKCHECECICVK